MSNARPLTNLGLFFFFFFRVVRKKLSSFCRCERWSIYLGFPLCRGSMSENEGKDKEAGSEDSDLIT